MLVLNFNLFVIVCQFWNHGWGKILEIFMTFKDQNYFLNYICFIFIQLANKAFQITVKTPDVVQFEFLDLS